MEIFYFKFLCPSSANNEDVCILGEFFYMPASEFKEIIFKFSFDFLIFETCKTEVIVLLHDNNNE